MQQRLTKASFMCLMVFISNVWAQDEPSKIYVPAKNGINPQILDKLTGKESAVLQGFGLTPPADCPPDSYWTSDTVKIMSCADGTKYFLEPLDSTKYPAGYMAVKPLLPVGETPEPGPDIMN